MKKRTIIEEYDSTKDVYLSLESMTSSLLNSLLSTENINIHSITSRTKDKSSLKSKVERPNKSYKKLNDITDVVGLRITTYFSDDVDKVAELISNELDIDDNNLIDKRKSLEPDRFGYMSLHIVAKHNRDRLKLKEYRKFNNIKFEIQIRSILQHAWAEIEHDIGYKTVEDVPSWLRRRFSRLAGLLELADEEFQQIKDNIQDYQSRLPKIIEEEPSEVSLDLDSLESLITKNPKVIELELKMKDVFKCELVKPSKRMISNSLESLSQLGVHSISELIDLYDEVTPYVIPFLKVWLYKNEENDPEGFGTIRQGISLLYLVYISLAQRDDKELSLQVLKKRFGEKVSTLESDLTFSYKKAIEEFS